MTKGISLYSVFDRKLVLWLANEYIELNILDVFELPKYFSN